MSVPIDLMLPAAIGHMQCLLLYVLWYVCGSRPYLMSAAIGPKPYLLLHRLYRVCCYKLYSVSADIVLYHVCDYKHCHLHHVSWLLHPPQQAFLVNLPSYIHYFLQSISQHSSRLLSLFSGEMCEARIKNRKTLNFFTTINTSSGWN